MNAIQTPSPRVIAAIDFAIGRIDRLQAHGADIRRMGLNAPGVRHIREAVIHAADLYRRGQTPLRATHEDMLHVLQGCTMDGTRVLLRSMRSGDPA